METLDKINGRPITKRTAYYLNGTKRFRKGYGMGMLSGFLYGICIGDTFDPMERLADILIKIWP